MKLRKNPPPRNTTPSSAKPRVWRRIGQGLLVASFVGVLAGGWVFHRAHAQVSEQLMDVGAQMMRYVDARHQDAPRDLMLNGQRIRLTSGTADRTRDEVLGFFEARCNEADGGLAEQLSALHADGDVDGSAGADSDRTLALREDAGARGFVACLDFRSSVDLSELTRRLERFNETGDVSDIGDMRYVFAEQYEHEGKTRTHFVAMWTTGSFNVARMFPEEGDAPGRDIEGVARPPEARRVLTGFERGQPYTLSVYQTREDEGVLDLFYRHELAREGFTVLETARPAVDAPRTLVAEDGERMVTLVFSTDPATGWASVAVVEAR